MALKLILCAVFPEGLNRSRISFSQSVFYSSVEKYLHKVISTKSFLSYSGLFPPWKKKNPREEVYFLYNGYAQITNRYFAFRRPNSEKSLQPESTSLSYASIPIYWRYLNKFLQSNAKEVMIYNKINRLGNWQEHLEDLKAIMVVPKGDFKTYLSNLCICSSL